MTPDDCKAIEDKITPEIAHCMKVVQDEARRQGKTVAVALM